MFDVVRVLNHHERRVRVFRFAFEGVAKDVDEHCDGELSFGVLGESERRL